MTEEALKDRARRIAQELLTQGDLAVAGELYDHGCAHHGAEAMGPGTDGVAQWVASLRRAFPDLTAIVEVDIAEGSRVAQVLALAGTHHGEFLGVPPSGRRVSWHLAIVLQAGPGGRFREQWSIWDQLGVQRQLGAAPPGQSFDTLTATRRRN